MGGVRMVAESDYDLPAKPRSTRLSWLAAQPTDGLVACLRSPYVVCVSGERICIASRLEAFRQELQAGLQKFSSEISLNDALAYRSRASLAAEHLWRFVPPALVSAAGANSPRHLTGVLYCRHPSAVLRASGPTFQKKSREMRNACQK